MVILLPDEIQKEVYESEIEPNLKEGATISFGHGSLGAGEMDKI